MNEDILLGAANKTNVVSENTELLLTSVPQVSLIAIVVDNKINGMKGTLDIVYNEETKEFDLELHNATISEGAQKFFEYIREVSGEFITNAIKAKESLNE